ncbi:MAG TPA: AAA family ATPase [Candidatus Acidoferrales bacterium]|nr:AAA family ATPase [Candidatus Acidoferrales bacterium]
MHLKSIHVKNFRALEEIHVDLDSRVSVVVGPNAIGKTTLLEAIRLVKAVVAPRSTNEPTQALLALGAAVPYNPQKILPTAIARDPKRPVEIRCRYRLEVTEIEALAAAMPELATDFTLNTTGRNPQNANFNLAFLSSPAGQAALTAAEKTLKGVIEGVRKGAQDLHLDLQFDPISSRFSSNDVIGGTIFGFLDGRNVPSQTFFSYFPADRALPPGEQPVQLGAADAGNQIESHVSQPQLKYSRLKNTIFNAVVTGPNEREELTKEFERIFEGILKGRKLVGVGVNKVGLLSIGVQDVETGRTFELDGMSSGEKGLILTFLLIGRSLVEGGIILLDEPELHLNPAVCKDLLSFLVDNYIVRRNLQAIICSHSPEILAGAFEKDECSLYHLVSEKVLSKVHYKDEEEISQALSRLGTSESEGLLYKATVFVEGPEDVDLLQVGFGDLLRRHKVKDLGGRREVEKQIEQLQEAEKKGTKLSPRYFIFDRDGVPSAIKDSEAVKVLQWDRRCLENYLIDLDVLTEFLKDGDVVKDPLPNQGEVSKVIRELAMSQIDEFAAREVYSSYAFDDPNLRAHEIRGKNLNEIADVLVARLEKIKGQIEPIIGADWKAKFIGQCEDNRRQKVLVWEARWADVCDGKRLFTELYRQRSFKLSLNKFKKRVMLSMRSVPTVNWRSIESLLKRLVKE